MSAEHKAEDKLIHMTDDEMRIAIAEVVFESIIHRESLSLYQRPKGTEGYRGSDLSGCWIYRRPDETFYGTNFETKAACRKGNIAELSKRNDYLNDLNACHEMQKAITDPCQRKAYWLYLDHDVDATARQRCIAFLKVIGKL